MDYTEIEELLKKYNWILESRSPLNICSLDGQHRASNYAAEVVIEYLAMLDYSNNQEEKDATIERFKLIEQKNESVKEPVSGQA